MKAKAATKSGSAPVSTQPFFNKSGNGTFFSKEVDGAGAFFNSGFAQASLTVGLPNDPYEKEADKVANQVVGNLDQVKNIQREFSTLGLQQLHIQPLTIASRISRKLQTHSSTTPFIQTKCSHCEQEEKMQEKSGNIQFAGNGSLVSSDMEKRIQSMRGGGQAMDGGVKTAMESSFGADFSNVRVHTNSQAVQMSQQLNAHAFTVGNEIFFNQQRYQPQNKLGAGLLAHELAHTIQQGAALQSKPLNTTGSNDFVSAQAGDSTASFGSIEKVTGHNKKAMLKKRSGLKLQRCPSGSPVAVSYRRYGGTGFGPESGGGSCPAYCACRSTDENGNPVTAGENRYSPRPINGTCPPGLRIVWRGSTIVSETPLETEPCGPGEQRSGCL